MEEPSAIASTIVATVTRIPRMQARPPITSGSKVMRSKRFSPARATFGGMAVSLSSPGMIAQPAPRCADLLRDAPRVVIRPKGKLTQPLRAAPRAGGSRIHTAPATPPLQARIVHARPCSAPAALGTVGCAYAFRSRRFLSSNLSGSGILMRPWGDRPGPSRMEDPSMKAIVDGQVVAESDDIVEAAGYQYFPRAAVRME